MEYIKNAAEYSIKRETAVTFGKFDGLHRGHKSLIEHVTRKQSLNMQAVVFTFDRPPAAILQKQMPKLLTTNEEKVSVFQELGVDFVLEYPVSDEMMHMAPEDFLQKIVRQLNIKYIAVGKDFHFGYQRKGDYQKILDYHLRLGYEVDILEKKQYKNRDISSSFVREEITKGNIKKGNMLLGHPFFIQGAVLHGNQIGRQLGMPTINLIPPEQKVLPPFGVYVSEIYFAGRTYQGISNIGRKPTIEGAYPIGVETHIFNFDQDIYDQTVKIGFLDYLREERRFDSIDQLKKQMLQDLALAKKYVT